MYPFSVESIKASLLSTRQRIDVKQTKLTKPVRLEFLPLLIIISFKKLPKIFFLQSRESVKIQTFIEKVGRHLCLSFSSSLPTTSLLTIIINNSKAQVVSC